MQSQYLEESSMITFVKQIRIHCPDLEVSYKSSFSQNLGKDGKRFCNYLGIGTEEKMWDT